MVLGLSKGNDFPTLSCPGYALNSNACKCTILTRITYKVSKSPTCLSYVICNTVLHTSVQITTTEQNLVYWNEIDTCLNVNV